MARFVVDPAFPGVLRELRQRAGLSYRELAKRINFAHTLVWQIETGRRRATPSFAQRADAALATAGALAGLVYPYGQLPGDTEERLVGVLADPSRVDRASVGALAELLAGQQRLEDVAGAQAVAPAARCGLGAVRTVAGAAAGTLRGELVSLTGQWAQYRGWPALATGAPHESEALFDAALAAAVEVGTTDLVCTVLSFKAHAAGLAGQPGALVSLTEAALRQRRVYVGQRAYDRFQLARGYALLGERRPALRALAQGRDLAGETAAYAGEAPPWHYYRTPAFFVLEEGLVRALLGRDHRRDNARAVELLTAGLSEFVDVVGPVEWLAEYARHLAHAVDRA